MQGIFQYWPKADGLESRVQLGKDNPSYILFSLESRLLQHIVFPTLNSPTCPISH